MWSCHALPAPDSYEDTLLENLLNVPLHYHEKRVRVVGICHIAFEGTVLFLNEQDNLLEHFDRSVWLSVDWHDTAVQSLSGQRVLVEARFDAHRRGHLGCCNGTLEPIHRMTPVSPQAERDQRSRAMFTR